MGGAGEGVAEEGKDPNICMPEHRHLDNVGGKPNPLFFIIIIIIFCRQLCALAVSSHLFMLAPA